MEGTNVLKVRYRLSFGQKQGREPGQETEAGPRDSIRQILTSWGIRPRGMARSREPDARSSEKVTMACVGGGFAYAR